MHVQVILAPYDSGHLRQRMGLGPERIYEAGLKDLFSRMRTDCVCDEISLGSGYLAEISAAFQLCRGVAERVRECKQRGIFPIVLSGNCNAAVGTVSGCGARDTAVVWFDAHGESTTPETTSSGFLDGMGISILAGQCWRTLSEGVPGFSPLAGKRIVLFGARDVEPAERSLLERMGVLQPVNSAQLAEILSANAEGFRQVYVHVDLDVLDPTVATANQWASSGGISLETLTGAIAEIQKHATISALGIASYDPASDHNGNALKAAVAVAEAALYHRS
jgi:arginase